MKYVSIIVCHFSLCDEFGEQKRGGSPPRSDMLAVTLSTLKKHSDYPCEIIVIDNGGPYDDSDYLTGLVRGGIINAHVRNKDNMNFGYSWNQGATIATGDYLCFTCNDIQFYEKWLSTTIKPLLDYPDKKLIATPYITPDKDKGKYDRGKLNNYRLNSFAGSNCMLMDRNVYKEVGEFTTSPTAGTKWHRKMNKLGYTIVAPPEDKAFHLAHQGGVDFYKPIKVIKTLLNGEKIDYSI